VLASEPALVSEPALASGPALAAVAGLPAVASVVGTTVPSHAPAFETTRVAHPVGPAEPRVAPLVDPALVFRDAASCAEAVRAREHLLRAGGVVRVAAWNVRWFPDGHPGKAQKAGEGTNIAWLACAIAWLDADVVVLEEVKRVPHAIAAADNLLAELGALTGATWHFIVDDCAEPARQHIAMVYRTDRVRSSGIATRGELDPTTQPGGTPSCPGRLRPGLSAYIKSLRGGADFHLVGVHFDSGKEERDYDDRQAAYAAVGPLKKTLATTAPDEDIVILGDFNTMGCSSRGISATAERDILAKAATTTGYRLASADVACTEYYKDHGTALDHVLVSTTMKEAAKANAFVAGACGALACRPLDATWLAAMADLSDHCPILIDLEDKDRD
jgi:endonuclease/exonuclease/phosphatase family metal-dependent hydrolase